MGRKKPRRRTAARNTVKNREGDKSRAGNKGYAAIYAKGSGSSAYGESASPPSRRWENERFVLSPSGGGSCRPPGRDAENNNRVTRLLVNRVPWTYSILQEQSFPLSPAFSSASLRHRLEACFHRNCRSLFAYCPTINIFIYLVPALFDD